MADHETVPVEIPGRGHALNGDLTVPAAARGLIIFAHGSGSSRFSPRNRFVAARLTDARFATLLADLLTPAEEAADADTGHLRFNIDLLAERVVSLVDWADQHPDLGVLPVGLFGASTGAAAALVAASRRPAKVSAVVSRGGRPDLAGMVLAHVSAPTLLIVGSLDVEVLELNSEAARQMRAPVRLDVIRGATHLFPEPGTLAQVASRAAGWFDEHLSRADRRERDTVLRRRSS
jgi:dienelactone hydrolase